MGNQSSEERYIARFPKSRAMYEQARGIMSRGVTHDAWYMLPFPVYIARASGSHEWDVDGYEYVDYWGGHGSAILGHAHPSLVEAINKQIQIGTQYGACAEQQLEWGELIKSIIPCAERVEFTNSGTESNMLTIRIARAFTGRQKVARFRGQFGGFPDHAMVGLREPWEVPITNGLLPAIAENTVIIPVNDEKSLEQALSGRDVAILMVEAAGAYSGVTGIAPSFYKVMRDLTTKYGTVLHFDEVVTGFRYAKNSVQAARGITPDLTSLGKVVTGGIPGAGAVVGRAEVMDMLLFKDDKDWNRFKRIYHSGTFNGNPLCAAAGTATLKILATGEPQKKAEEAAKLLRKGMQQAMDEQGIEGCVYGDFSVYHMHFGECELQEECDRTICLNDKKVVPASISTALATNLLLNGVHPSVRAIDGFISAAHTREDLDKTVEAFSASLKTMLGEGVLKTV